MGLLQVFEFFDKSPPPHFFVVASAAFFLFSLLASTYRTVCSEVLYFPSPQLERRDHNGHSVWSGLSPLLSYPWIKHRPSSNLQPAINPKGSRLPLFPFSNSFHRAITINPSFFLRGKRPRRPIFAFLVPSFFFFAVLLSLPSATNERTNKRRGTEHFLYAFCRAQNSSTFLLLRRWRQRRMNVDSFHSCMGAVFQSTLPPLNPISLPFVPTQ